MNLLLFERTEVGEASRVVLADARGAHLTRVLRVVVGDEVRAGVIGGPVGTARVLELDAERVVLDVAAVLGGSVPDRPRVDLVLALPRPKVFARLLPDITALGVGSVWVTGAARVERYYFDSHRLDADEIRRRCLEGLTQARDTRLPAISVQRSLESTVKDRLPPGGRRVFADLPRGSDAGDLRESCAALRPEERIVIAIGPEGGWLDAERALLDGAGFVAMSLGPRVLSVGVACAVALGLAHAALRSRADVPLTR